MAFVTVYKLSYYPVELIFNTDFIGHHLHDAFQTSPYNESSTIATIHEVEFGFESIKLNMECQAILNLFKSHGFSQIQKLTEYNEAHRCQSTKYLLKYENRQTFDRLGA